METFEKPVIKMINGSRCIFVELDRSTKDVCNQCDFYQGRGTCNIYDPEHDSMILDYCLHEENSNKVWKKLNNKQNGTKNK